MGIKEIPLVMLEHGVENIWKKMIVTLDLLNLSFILAKGKLYYCNKYLHTFVLFVIIVLIQNSIASTRQNKTNEKPKKRKGGEIFCQKRTKMK